MLHNHLELFCNNYENIDQHFIGMAYYTLRISSAFPFLGHFMMRFYFEFLFFFFVFFSNILFMFVNQDKLVVATLIWGCCKLFRHAESLIITHNASNKFIAKQHMHALNTRIIYMTNYNYNYSNIEQQSLLLIQYEAISSNVTHSHHSEDGLWL